MASITIFFSEKGCYDARNLLISILSIKVLKPFSFFMELALILFFFVRLANYVSLLVENHDKLAICSVEVPAKLHIHVARDACPDTIRQPNKEIDGVERDIQLALFLINPV